MCVPMSLRTCTFEAQKEEKAICFHQGESATVKAAKK